MRNPRTFDAIAALAYLLNGRSPRLNFPEFRSIPGARTLQKFGRIDESESADVSAQYTGNVDLIPGVVVPGDSVIVHTADGRRMCLGIVLDAGADDCLVLTDGGSNFGGASVELDGAMLKCASAEGPGPRVISAQYDLVVKTGFAHAADTDSVKWRTFCV